MGAPGGCDWATEEMRVGCTSHCRSWLVVMAVTVGTKEPGMSPRPLHSCAAAAAPGLPKESTEERYWDSAEGEELHRDPES